MFGYLNHREKTKQRKVLVELWGTRQKIFSVTSPTEYCDKNVLSTEFTGKKQVHQEPPPVPCPRCFAVFKVLFAKGMPFRSQQVLCAKVVAQKKKWTKTLRAISALQAASAWQWALSIVTSTWKDLILPSSCPSVSSPFLLLSSTYNF